MHIPQVKFWSYEDEPGTKKSKGKLQRGKQYYDKD